MAGGGWVGRGIQVAAQLVAIRILSDSLGTTGYGAFAVLTSLTGWLILSDFSIAVSTQNYISERRAAGQESGDIILTGALLSLIAACIAAAVMLLLGSWLSEMLLGKFVSSTSDRMLAFYAMAFPGIGTALGTVVYRIWFAQHRGYLSNLLPALGTMIGTTAIAVASRLDPEPALAWNTLLYYTPMAVLPLLALIMTVVRIPRQRAFRPRLAMPLLRRASHFWITGVLSALVLQVDYIIISQFLLPEDVVIYNVISKVFMLIFFVYTALLQALWPVCSEAIARRQWHEVFAAIRKYVLIGIAFTAICGAGFLLANRTVVDLIAPTLGSALPPLVIILFTFYYAVRIWTDTFGMVLQSMNKLRIFWIVVPVQSVLSIGLQILGAHLWGLPGLVVGLILCFVLTVAWILPLTVARIARTATLAT